MGNARKFEQRKGTVADAVSGAVSELQSLAEEVREVVDNASGTPRENTQRIQTLDETATALEDINEPETVVESIWDIDGVSWTEIMPRSKRQPLSRSDRRDNAASMLDGAIQVLQDKIDDESTADDDTKEAMQSLVDDLERIKDEAEGVEFPGMYG